MGFFDLFKSKKEQAEQKSAEQERKELDAGLEKTKQGFFSKLAHAVAGRSTVDMEVLDELEEVLITSDVGVETTVKIINRIEERVARDKYIGSDELQNILHDEIARLMEEAEGKSDTFGLDVKQGMPYVVMVVGVNGAGKTTTIGKLAAQLVRAGKRVYIGAADTFRAAAIDQLQVWCDRAGVEMVRQNEGSDPAAVVFDAINYAKKKNADVLIIDTAGRLHNKTNLMNELAKINRVIDRELPGAARENLLVLDATTGQNAIIQAKEFGKAANITGLTLNKLDGTAKGGIVLSIKRELGIPVKFIGVGEKIDDMQEFVAADFIKALFEQ